MQSLQQHKYASLINNQTLSKTVQIIILNATVFFFFLLPLLSFPLLSLFCISAICLIRLLRTMSIPFLLFFRQNMVILLVKVDIKRYLLRKLLDFYTRVYNFEKCKQMRVLKLMYLMNVRYLKYHYMW